MSIGTTRDLASVPVPPSHPTLNCTQYLHPPSSCPGGPLTRSHLLPAEARPESAGVVPAFKRSLPCGAHHLSDAPAVLSVKRCVVERECAGASRRRCGAPGRCRPRPASPGCAGRTLRPPGAAILRARPAHDLISMSAMTLTPAIAIRAGAPKDPDVHATHQHLSPSRRAATKSHHPRWHQSSSSPLSHNLDEADDHARVTPTAQHLLSTGAQPNGAVKMSMCVGA